MRGESTRCREATIVNGRIRYTGNPATLSDRGPAHVWQTSNHSFPGSDQTLPFLVSHNAVQSTLPLVFGFSECQAIRHICLDFCTSSRVLFPGFRRGFGDGTQDVKLTHRHVEFPEFERSRENRQRSLVDHGQFLQRPSAVLSSKRAEQRSLDRNIFGIGRTRPVDPVSDRVDVPQPCS